MAASQRVDPYELLARSRESCKLDSCQLSSTAGLRMSRVKGPLAKDSVHDEGRYGRPIVEVGGRGRRRADQSRQERPELAFTSTSNVRETTSRISSHHHAQASPYRP
jgi:hypothetical protein